MLRECDHPPGELMARLPADFSASDSGAIARALSTLEGSGGSAFHRARPGGSPSVGPAAALRKDIKARLRGRARCPVVGVTGTGGAGKSSLVDELLSRFLEAFPDKRAAVLCVDPSRRLTGGALLGDRLRVNTAGKSERVFFRSLATRRAHASLSAAVGGGTELLRAAGFDLILLETAGIGQSDTEVAGVCDFSLY